MTINFSFSSTLFVSVIILSFPFTHASLKSQSLLASQIKAESGGVVTLELWCVAKNNAEDSALQSAIDWACGPGGANCAAIQQGAPCYDPTDIQRTASFVFNDYFLHHGLTEDSCSFDNTAALTSLNPSFGDCKFPSSFTVSKGSSSNSTIGALGGTSSAITSGRSRIGSGWCWSFVPVHLLITIIWFV